MAKMGDTVPLVTTDSASGTGDTFEPVELRVIDRFGDLRVIAHSLRVHILDCLAEQEMTVRDVQKRLGTSSTSLYYHVGELERAGFIQLVRTEIQAGIQLKFYRAAARYFYVSLALLHGTSDEVDASASFMASLMETTARNLQISFSSGLIDQTPGTFVVSHRQHRMSHAAAMEFRRRIEELDKDFERASEPEGEVSVEFAVALFPR